MSPILPTADLSKLADSQLATGRRDEAIALYIASLERNPTQPSAWFNLGWALRAARRFEEALGAYEKAIGYGVSRPEEAFVNRATILSDHLFHADAAIEELERALDISPEYLPALLGLGVIREDRGDVDGARRAYERAVAAAPGNGRAIARLGAVIAAAGDPAAATRWMQAGLEQARDPGDKAEVLFALGGAFDQLGRYDDAFPAIEAANWITRSLAPRRYDPRRQEELTDRLIATFRTRQPRAGSTSDPSSPLFICGMFRSGSTLAERLLSRHPAIVAAGELEFIPALAASLTAYPTEVPDLTDDQLTSWRHDYRRPLPQAPLVIDKRCDNFQHLGLARRLFPNGRIVHTRRDPLDNLLSVYFQHFGDEISYGQDLVEATHYYIQYRRLVRHWQTRVFDDIIDLDYDCLVNNTEATLRVVTDALNLPWSDAVLSAADEHAEVRTASTWQVRQPVHARSSGRWRHYAKQLAEPRRLLAAAGI